MSERERELEIQVYRLERALYCRCHDLEMERYETARLRDQLRHAEGLIESLCDRAERAEAAAAMREEFIHTLRKAEA